MDKGILARITSARLRGSDSLQCFKLNADQIGMIIKYVRPAIQKTGECVPKNSSRALNSGALLGLHVTIDRNVLTAYGSNGSRLATFTDSIEPSTDQAHTLPAKALTDLNKQRSKWRHNGALFAVDCGRLLVLVNDTLIYEGDVIQASYPRFETAMPNVETAIYDARLRNTAFIVECAKEAALLSAHGAAKLVLTKRESYVTLAESHNYAQYRADIQTEMYGNNLSICFNADYLADALNASIVRLRANDPLAAVVFDYPDPRVKHLLMPMQI